MQNLENEKKTASSMSFGEIVYNSAASFLRAPVLLFWTRGIHLVQNLDRHYLILVDLTLYRHTPCFQHCHH